jgi:predicted phosphodiesterase
MKIALGSDLHLEFGDFDPVNEQAADVLILSGDIMVAEDLYKFPAEYKGDTFVRSRSKDNADIYRNFLAACAGNFKKVVYVAGNHEFYHGKFFKTLDVLREECNRFDNVEFLEDQSIKIDDVVFVGGTLWTDMNKGDPTTYYECQRAMNDYRTIVNDHVGYTKLRPVHTHDKHRKTLQFIKHMVADLHTAKVVVVGHHAPSKISTKPEYEDDFYINGAYSSDLSEFILDHPQIKVWTHGHTHHEFDYMMGSTRILCNPRGYVGYERGTQKDDPYTFKYFQV